MRVPRIYLETTMFNYYFDTDRDAHPDTVTLFEDCAAGLFKPYTSTYVTDELEDAPPEKREKMLSLIEKYGVEFIEATAEINALADEYIASGALPRNSLSDARHIAVAAVGGLDMIVSLNFRHIVKERTRELTEAVNKLRGYDTAKILSPMEVLDCEKTGYNLGRNPRDTAQD